MRISSAAAAAIDLEAALINEAVLSADGDLTGDELLIADLERCAMARPLIAPEQARIKEEIEIEPNPVRADYLRWQHDHVEHYINWAARNAEARLSYIAKLKTVEARATEVALCQFDVLHWFRAWAWTMDPRMPVLPVVPFVPFRFQCETITWLDTLIRVRHSDGMVDKSRDQGASWTATALSVYYWRFVAYAQILFGSYKEELVDSKEKLDTLLEKCRFQIRRLPTWMAPSGFDSRKDMAYMAITNRESGALIAGAAPTENFGRAGRYTVIWLDELAAWRFSGYPQWTACSQSAQAKIPISTPRGKANQQADLRFSGKMPVKSLRWQEHPWKDQRWYEGQTLTMSDQQIAQEIDINYEASTPGRIFGMYHEAFHVITWSEFKAVYGVDHIPLRWNLGRIQDVGTSEGHEPTTDWFARPPENDKLWDTIFWYRSFVAPVSWSVGEIGEGKWGPGKKLLEPGIWQKEKPLKEKERMRFSLISWEAESEVRSYARDCKQYPLSFSRHEKPSPIAGIAQAQTMMRLLPEPHPFVKDPRTGKPLFGRPRAILIVPDAQGALNVDDEGYLSRTPPVDDEGLINPRTEFVGYRWKVEMSPDKPVPVRVPFKRDDNSMDNFRYVCRRWGPPPAELTRRERVEQNLPEQLRSANLPPPEQRASMTGEEISALMNARMAAVAKAEKDLDAAELKRHRKREQTTRRRGAPRRRRR
jgi:hypothetical protein